MKKINPENSLENGGEIMLEALKRIDSLKKKVDLLRPLDVVATQKLAEALKYEGIYNSNAIEGNTLTLNETMIVIETGMTIGGKSWREHTEAVNLSVAVDFIEELVKMGVDLNLTLIRQIHQVVLASIGGRSAGNFRSVNVRISGSEVIPPDWTNVPSELEKLMDKYYDAREKGTHPVVLASWFHLEFVRIHPFTDGNGRTARLLMNLILMQDGFPPIVLFAERTHRLEYMKSIELYVAKNYDKDFLGIITKRVIDTLELYVELLTPGKLDKSNEFGGVEE